MLLVYATRGLESLVDLSPKKFRQLLALVNDRGAV